MYPLLLLPSVLAAFFSGILANWVGDGRALIRGKGTDLYGLDTDGPSTCDRREVASLLACQLACLPICSRRDGKRGQADLGIVAYHGGMKSFLTYTCNSLTCVPAFLSLSCPVSAHACRAFLPHHAGRILGYNLGSVHCLVTMRTFICAYHQWFSRGFSNFGDLRTCRPCRYSHLLFSTLSTRM